MKKLILGALLLLSTVSFGQITKIETLKPLKTTKIAPMGNFWVGADFYSDAVEITFQDIKFTKIRVLRFFKLSPDDFNSLGKILTSEDNKVDDFYSIKTLDDKELYFKFNKSFGVMSPIILLKDGIIYCQFPNLTKSQLKKLFDIK